MNNVCVDDEGFYKNKDDEILASKYSDEFLIFPVEVLISIFKMIRELKSNYRKLWDILS
jgi:hypothetical protein